MIWVSPYCLYVTNWIWYRYWCNTCGNRCKSASLVSVPMARPTNSCKISLWWSRCINGMNKMLRRPTPLTARTAPLAKSQVSIKLVNELLVDKFVIDIEITVFKVNALSLSVWLSLSFYQLLNELQTTFALITQSIQML